MGVELFTTDVCVCDFACNLCSEFTFKMLEKYSLPPCSESELHVLRIRALTRPTTVASPEQMPHRRRTPPLLSRVEFLQHCPNDVLFAILGHLLDTVSPRDAAFFASTCKYARAFARSALTELKGDAEAVRSFYKVVRRANRLTKLSKLSSLTRLNACAVLENNHLAQQGLWIACARGALPKLETLNLEANRIGDPGISALADACARGGLPKLEALQLYRNQIGDAGVSALASACARGAMEKLEVLLLVNNQIGDPGVSALADACARGALPLVSDLWLDDNKIGDAGCTALADACARGALPALKGRLHLGGNPVSQKARHAAEDAIKNRK